MTHDFSAFQWAIYFLRLFCMIGSAAFAATLIRMVQGRQWSALTKSSRAWAIALLAYSLNVTLFVALVFASAPAVFPDSIIWAGFALSIILLHRALINSRSGELT